MATDFPGKDGPYNLASKLIGSHLVDGVMSPGEEIGRIDQTLTQDATGTLVMQELGSLWAGACPH